MNQSLRILIIDDNPDIHNDFQKILKFSTNDSDLDNLESNLFGSSTPSFSMPDFDIDSAFQGEEGIEKVKQALSDNSPYSLAFVDIRMPPGIDGVKTILQIWKIDPAIQTVICTAYSDYSWSDMAEKFGKTDRLLILKKPFDNIEIRQLAITLTQKYLLAKTVRNQVESLNQLVQERTAELENSLKKLEYNATHDLLTGLPNRTLLSDRLDRAVLVAQTKNVIFPLIILDLMHFNEVEKRLGHHISDEILQQYAQRIKQYLHEDDSLVRYSHSEFVIIPFTLHSEKHIILYLETIYNELIKPLQIDKSPITIPPCIGISLYPKDGQDENTLLSNAANAMYKAKKFKLKYQFYREEMNINAIAQLKQASDLRRAIESQEFILHYQPIVDLKRYAIASMEALIRWQHTSSKLISPLDFIPLAEDTGLIIPIGEWALNTACIQNKKWQELGAKPICISVNFSGIQLQNDHAVEFVKNALDLSKLDPKYLELELTESILMEKSQDIISKMHYLKEMRISLAIDDFGTGYSNLSYLRQFPLSKLKIDKSFINGIESSASDRALVLAIIALGHALGLKVLAEGVETKEQLEFLRKNNCDEAQGFYFSRPVDDQKAFNILMNGLSTG